MGKTKVQAPQPTAEERALQQAQRETLDLQRSILEEQQRVNDLLIPLFAQEAGFTPTFGGDPERLAELRAREQELVDAAIGFPTFESDGEGREITLQNGQSFRVGGTGLSTDPSSFSPEANELSDIRREIAELEAQAGQITGFERSALTEAEQAREDIELELLEREQLALAGELPVGQGLLRDLAKREEDLKNTLRAQLGTDFETSSPGIEALNEFRLGSDALKESVAKGDIGNFAALQLSQSGFNRQSDLSNLGTLSTGANINSGTAGQFSQLAAGFGSAQQPFQFNRNQQFQAALQNAQSPSPLGSVFGAVVGGLAGNPGLGLAAGNALFGN